MVGVFVSDEDGLDFLEVDLSSHGTVFQTSETDANVDKDGHVVGLDIICIAVAARSERAHNNIVH